MTTVSITELSFLFALLVQTAVISFLFGRLFQRVSHLEQNDRDRENLGLAVVKLEVQMETHNKTLEKVCHNVENMQRQLANIATDRIGRSGEL